jgi:hypothetical protein
MTQAPAADRPADTAVALKPAAKATVSKPAASKTAARKAPVARTAATKSSDDKALVAAAKTAEKAAAASVAPKVDAASPAKAPSAKPIVTKPLAAKPVRAKPAAAKPAPAAAAQPAGPLAALGSLFSMPALSPGFVPPALAATEFPVPAFGAEMMADFASRWIEAARTLGTVQARLLDHGVSQLKAGMDEFEACARSSHPSEVVVIQARALRRSSDALTDTLKAVSDTARKAVAPR